MPLGSRREARERALELLYECEVKEQSPEQVLSELPLAPDPYAVALLEGVSARRLDIDGLLDRLSRGWPVERMAWVDRNLLRIGAFELLEQADVPTAVAINEAVELAKRYGTSDETPRFVNGILAAVAREARGEAAGPDVGVLAPSAAGEAVAWDEVERPAPGAPGTFKVLCGRCRWQSDELPAGEVPAAVERHAAAHGGQRDRVGVYRRR